MRIFDHGVNMAAGAGGAFGFDDIPSQILRVDHTSFAGAGGILTGLTDASGAGETVAISGSPTYTAADANVNGQPSFIDAGGSSVIAPNVNRASIAFVAAVVHMASTGSHYVFDADESSGRTYLYRSGGGFALTNMGNRWMSPEEPVVGRKRVLLPFDGATDLRWNGVNYGTIPANTGSGTGVRLGAIYSGSYQSTLSFLMLCSAVPSSDLRAALDAALLARFG